MLRKCPHRRLPKWLQVQTFYNGLSYITRNIVDVVETQDKTYKLLEKMTLNQYQWPSNQMPPTKLAGIHHIDFITTLNVDAAELKK